VSIRLQRPEDGLFHGFMLKFTQYFGLLPLLKRFLNWYWRSIYQRDANRRIKVVERQHLMQLTVGLDSSPDVL